MSSVPNSAHWPSGYPIRRSLRPAPIPGGLLRCYTEATCCGGGRLPLRPRMIVRAVHAVRPLECRPLVRNTRGIHELFRPRSSSFQKSRSSFRARDRSLRFYPGTSHDHDPAPSLRTCHDPGRIPRTRDTAKPTLGTSRSYSAGYAVVWAELLSETRSDGDSARGALRSGLPENPSRGL